MTLPPRPHFSPLSNLFVFLGYNLIAPPTTARRHIARNSHIMYYTGQQDSRSEDVRVTVTLLRTTLYCGDVDYYSSSPARSSSGWRISPLQVFRLVGIGGPLDDDDAR